MDDGGHPFRIGLRQGCVGREDGGHRGEVSTAHARVKDLEVRRDHCGSACFRRCGVRQSIRPSSTGSEPTNYEHYEEIEYGEQIRFSYEGIHRIFSPFCDWLETVAKIEDTLRPPDTIKVCIQLRICEHMF